MEDIRHHIKTRAISRVKSAPKIIATKINARNITSDRVSRV